MQFTDQLRRRSPVEMGIMALVFVFLMATIYTLIPEEPKDIETNFCGQPKFMPLKGNFTNSSQFYEPTWAEQSVKVLQGAIRIPTVSYDDMDLNPGNEPRFKVFKKLHNYLFETFPLASKHAETVSIYGILYTFPGIDTSLKPVVLMAHQDVVPVAESTLDQWDYAPFEAHFDGEWIYGRGTADTKDSLLAILEAVESLLKQRWSPERTLILSFGFDEEISGYRGARPLAETIKSRYGINGVEVIVDEGFGIECYHGAYVAGVTVAEKGYIDIQVSLTTPGGHSSMPPDHTGIGIISRLVKEIEAHPYMSELENSNPTLGFYRCLAEHSPNMNKQLRRTILDIDFGEHRSLLTKHIEGIPNQKYLIKTSQAVDIIRGGVKINALPEQVYVKVNHRVNINSNTAAVIDRFEELLSDIAEEFGLGVESHGETLMEATPNGFFNITSARNLKPSPISPHLGAPWDLIGSTTRSIIEGYGIEKPLIIAPTLFPANTDTRYYWDLSRAIYRFKPGFIEDFENHHTVNERLRVRSHLMSVAWYYEFIINSTL